MPWLEIISLVGGFIFQVYANNQKNQHDLHKRALGFHEASEASVASARAFCGGTWIRRLIVCSLVFSAVFVPFIAGMFEIPLVVEKEIVVKGWLMGIFPDKVMIDFVPIAGIFQDKEVWNMMKIIIFFYFGRSAGKA
jgi:hypothetical protein